MGASEPRRNSERIALDEGPRRLVVSWVRNFEEIRVEYDGVLLGDIAGKAELKAGQTFQLPDGASVFVKYHSALFSPGFEVHCDGRHSPNSAFDPREQVRNAAYLLYFLGAAGAARGVYWMVFSQLEGATMAIGGAALLAGLGLLLHRRQSQAAAWIATALFCLSCVGALLGVTAVTGIPSGFFGIIMNLLFISILIKSVRATRQIEALDAPRQGMDGAASGYEPPAADLLDEPRPSSESE